MITEFFKDFIKDENGQSTVEYILLLAVMVVGVAQLRRQILNGLDKGTLRLGAQLEKDLKTGRVPLGAWKN